MTRPLKFDTATTPDSLKEMTDAEIEYAAYEVLKHFASSEEETGAVRLDSNFSGTLIGSFTDTRRNNAVGDHPAGTEVTSTTTNFYQILTARTETPTRPVKFDTTLNGIQQMSDTDLDNTIIEKALQMLTDTTDDERGMGQYKLQPNSPSEGTWTNVGQISNNIINTSTSDIVTNSTILWRNTLQTNTPTTTLPLKVRSDGHLQQMTTAEIHTLTDRLQNRIVSTEKAKYKLQAAAPTSGGTWVRQGSAFTDTKRELADENYSGTYAGSRTYSGSYSSNFTGSYLGPGYTGYYNGIGTVFYGGTPFQQYQNFAGTYAASYSGTYTGNFAGSRNYTDNYTGQYTGSTVQTSTEDVTQVSLWMRTV